MTHDRATLPFDFEETEVAPRRGRRVWPWVVTLVVVVGLVGGAAVGAEGLARGAVEGGVRQLVVLQLDVPAGQEVDVDVEGLVLPQLLSGRLDEISVAAPGFQRGPLGGDISVTLTDVPIAVDRAAGPGSASVRLDENQLRALLRSVEGFPADSVTVTGGALTLSTELSPFGTAIPLGVSLQPGAAKGDLTLTPTAFQLGGTDVTAEALRSRFGSLADPVLREWSVCIAQHLPAALTLTSVEAADGSVVATFDIDGAVVIDSALRENGACG
jgi:hypothetical protein